MPLLFSYGTLQDPDVQLATFGRGLAGAPDTLPGCELATVVLDGTHYANVRRNGRSDSLVPGTVFEIDAAGLARADAYEADAGYRRQVWRLASGKHAWVYLAGADSEQQRSTVQEYLEGFRHSDRERVLACLTDDVEWHLPGVFQVRGRDAFADHIVDDGFTGSPAIGVDRLAEAGNVVVAEGTVRTQRTDGSVLELAYCDVFELADGLIRGLTSYIMPLASPPATAVAGNDVPRPPAELATERLRLRRPSPADAGAVFERWAADPEVTRFLRWQPHARLADTAAHLAGCVQRWEAGSEFVWLIEDRRSARLLGSLAARPGGHGVELGYLLARDAWGRGYMVEAVRAVAGWYLEQGVLERVWATCDVENTASARVLEKAGFEFEGVLRRWDVHPGAGGQRRDARCYSLTRER
jgi:RimJ/RimL family protein N-acetyltransferase/gamma-glutamylcyclotransferase (GGCT)/AIG2-like uncharacterized protein YtfP